MIAMAPVPGTANACEQNMHTLVCALWIEALMLLMLLATLPVYELCILTATEW